MPSNSNRTKQQQEPSADGHVTMRLYFPEFQKRAARLEVFIVDQVAIRNTLFRPVSTSNLENFKQDDILLGRGVVVIPLKGPDLKCFLTFSPEKNQVYHSTNAPRCGKWPHGVAIIESAVPERQRNSSDEFSIELYKTWAPSNSEYEGPEEFFGRVVVSAHSGGVDPKRFLTFSTEQSSADRKLRSPATGYQKNTANLLSLEAHVDLRPEGEGTEAMFLKLNNMELNGVPGPSMTSGAITQEITDETDTSVGTSLPHCSHDAESVKRKLSHDGMRSELRRSGRLTRRART